MSKPKETKSGFNDDFEKKFADMKLQQDKFDDKWKMSSNSSTSTKPG